MGTPSIGTTGSMSNKYQQIGSARGPNNIPNEALTQHKQSLAAIGNAHNYWLHTAPEKARDWKRKPYDPKEF